MAKQFLDYAGLQTFWDKIKGFVGANYVANVEGKGLSTNDFTNDDKSKLTGIESGAQVNVIETIKLGGTELTVSNKEVNIPVESTLSNSTNPIQTAVVNTATATLASAVDKSVQSVKGDAYVSASLSDVGDGSQDGQKLAVAATSELKNAINTAKTALQKGDIVSGTSNGTINVGGEDVAVKGLGSAAYTESSAYAPASLSKQVEANTGDIKDLKSKVAGLASATKFIGVQTSLPTTANAGDICIVGNKEYIWDETTSNVNGKAGWVELGDVTDVSERITNIENSYVSSFGGVGGKQKEIIIDTDSTDIGKVKFAMSSNKLTGTVNVGTTSFGGKTGAITVNSGSTTAGDVNFAMDNNKLTGKVVLPDIINGITVTDSTTIDMTLNTTTTPGTPNIIASAKTGAVASNAATLTTGGQVYTYVTGVVNGLNSISNTATPVENETAETVAVAVEKPFTMITSVSQTNGTVNVGTTELGPIPISAITALS